MQIRTILLFCAAALAGTGCALYDPGLGEPFDPLVESKVSPAGQPEFQSVGEFRRLDPVLLDPDPAPYRLGPGDKVMIEIAERDGTAQICLVMPDGNIYFDLAGGVEAQGKTLAELSQVLSERLGEHYTQPIVTVNLSEVQNARYQVLGAVNTPGVYPIDKPTRLLDAISTAGGMLNGTLGTVTQEMAALNRAMVIRGGKALPVNFQSLVKEGDMTQNIYVKSGDYIYLPSAQNQKIYVLGWVVAPRAISFSQPITAIEAIAKAEGPRPNAFLSRAIVIRGSTTDPVVAVVNLRDVAVGRGADFTLESGDILWVPKNPWSKLGEYVYEILDSAATAVAVAEGAAILEGDSSVEVTIPAGSSGSVGIPVN